MSDRAGCFTAAPTHMERLLQNRNHTVCQHTFIISARPRGLRSSVLPTHDLNGARPRCNYALGGTLLPRLRRLGGHYVFTVDTGNDTARRNWLCRADGRMARQSPFSTYGDRGISPHIVAWHVVIAPSPVPSVLYALPSIYVVTERSPNISRGPNRWLFVGFREATSLHPVVAFASGLFCLQGKVVDSAAEASSTHQWKVGLCDSDTKRPSR